MSRLRHWTSLLLELLRELADENAYRRHLAAHGQAPSPEAWRKFCDERLKARFVRPRCC
ncbi:MAG: hypothetical protein RMI94_11125 [Bryobacterales bacterium]|nr:hypothetical protein [Bryobacteraceae bacterium]MDW8131092.1 hypothetical protein [Bryobacterales bacterium]